MTTPNNAKASLFTGSVNLHCYLESGPKTRTLLCLLFQCLCITTTIQVVPFQRGW